MGHAKSLQIFASMCLLLLVIIAYDGSCSFDTNMTSLDNQNLSRTSIRLNVGTQRSFDAGRN